jgi:hypothetical protein
MSAAETNPGKIWVTLSGLPLTIRLEWPFRASSSGSDFWVLHGDIRLEGSGGLHAPVAVNMSQTVREVLQSLDPEDAEAPVINTLRKEVDRRQIEFLRSGKLLPVPFSSRHYDFKRKQWVFGKASDDATADFLEKKIFWETRLDPRPTPPQSAALGVSNSEPTTRIWIADPAEAQYLQTTPQHLVDIVDRLVAPQGLLRVEEEDWAIATPALMAQADRFENLRLQAVDELEKKHAFERG